MLKLLQLETNDLRTEQICSVPPSPQPEAQRDSWNTGAGGSEEMLGVQGQNVSLRFNINCGYYNCLVWRQQGNPTSSSTILLDT